MKVVVNDDETITVSGLFDNVIKEALAVRPKIWNLVEQEIRNEYKVEEEVLYSLRKLFCGGRIDMNRVVMALRNGDLQSIRIDADPWKSDEGQNQLLSDEAKNDILVAQSLFDKHGIKSTSRQNENEMARFEEERENLRRQGMLLPGIRGI
jgi:hypothetical protein